MFLLLNIFLLGISNVNSQFTFKSLDENNSTIKLSDKYPINRNLITISGFSAGGGYVSRFSIIHSKIISGVGIFDYAYFGYYTKHSIKESLELMAELEKGDLIDSRENFRDMQVYVWASTHDYVSLQSDMGGHVETYDPYLKSPYQLFTKVQKGGHQYPGQNCTKYDKSLTRSICLYPAFYEMMCHLTKKKLKNMELVVKPGKYYNFDVSEFYKEGKLYDIGIEDLGLIYVPFGCEENQQLREKCYIHFYFTGCNGKKHTPESVRENLEQYKIIHVADANKIIIVAPYTNNNPKISKKGCWDSRAKTGKDFENKNGKQVVVVRRIIQRMTGK